MWATILALTSGLLLPLIKWLVERAENKKLSDKEFLEYIAKHQSQRAKAGQTAEDWEKALKEAQDQMDKPAEPV